MADDVTRNKESGSPAGHGSVRSKSGPPWVRWLVLALLVAGIAIAWWQFRERLNLAFLAEHESALRTFQHEHPLLVYGVAFGVYVAVTGLSLPGAAALTVTFGWFFGFLPAVLLVSFASTTGATIAFLISRFLLRDAVQSRFGDRLQGFNQALTREGSFYLFTLRLIPAVPFFVINIVMGLTPLRTWTFWWVSQLGMLPGTCVFVYAGSTIPSLAHLADPSQLRTADIDDWPGLLAKLRAAGRSAAASPRQRVWHLLPEDVQTLVNETAGSESDPAVRLRLIDALNELLKRPDLALAAPWTSLEFGTSLRNSSSPADLRQLTSVNRTLLVIAFPEHIGPPRAILTPQLIIAFVALGLFPLLVKKLLARWKSSSVEGVEGDSRSEQAGSPMS